MARRPCVCRLCARGVSNRRVLILEMRAYVIVGRARAAKTRKLLLVDFTNQRMKGL